MKAGKANGALEALELMHHVELAKAGWRRSEGGWRPPPPSAPADSVSGKGAKNGWR